MKRFFTMIVAIGSILVAMAQQQVATLSHKGELTAFNGIYALEYAIDASEEGDIIYLSEGEFVKSGDASKGLLISKHISIVGCGYKSHIIPPIYIEVYIQDSYSESDFEVDNILPFFDGVKLNDLFISGNNFDLIKFSIVNSYIDLMKCDDPLYDAEFNINKCFINKMTGTEYADGTIRVPKNINIRNSKIVDAQDALLYADVANCNIKNTTKLPHIITSSVIEKFERYSGEYHTVYNSLFGEDISDSYVLLHDCYFEPDTELLDENLNSIIDLQSKDYLGQDGTVIGAYGGENPFSEHPSVPTIDSEKSSVEYDAESKKLNVTITVAQD